MRIIIFFILISLAACTGKSDKETQNPPFEAITKNLSYPSAMTEKEETLGEAVTEIIDTGINRVSNISVAAQSISGKVLAKGEEFSFNKTTGERSGKNGYKYAPVIFHGEKSYGIGGGVCQVSTTLYMAVKNANLRVTQRHRHSEHVAYAPGGDDATVVFGEKDFCFENNTDNDIYIYVWVENNQVYAKLVKKVSYAESDLRFGN